MGMSVEPGGLWQLLLQCVTFGVSCSTLGELHVSQLQAWNVFLCGRERRMMCRSWLTPGMNQTNNAVGV